MKNFITSLLILCCTFLFNLQVFANLPLNDEITSAYKYNNQQIQQQPEVITYKLSANSPVIIKNNNTIDTNKLMQYNQNLFSIENDVCDKDGNVIIMANTPVTANLSYEKNGRLGKSAKLAIYDLSTTTVDGTIVPLKSNIYVAPNDKKLLSLALGIGVFPAFLLMKGENAQIAANSIYTVYTVNDISITKTIN